MRQRNSDRGGEYDDEEHAKPRRTVRRARECGATNDRGVAHRLTRGEACREGAELRFTCLANLAGTAHDAALRTNSLG